MLFNVSQEGDEDNDTPRPFIIIGLVCAKRHSWLTCTLRSSFLSTRSLESGPHAVFRTPRYFGTCVTPIRRRPDLVRTYAWVTLAAHMVSGIRARSLAMNIRPFLHTLPRIINVVLLLRSEL